MSTTFLTENLYINLEFMIHSIEIWKKIITLPSKKLLNYKVCTRYMFLCMALSVFHWIQRFQLEQLSKFCIVKDTENLDDNVEK